MKHYPWLDTPQWTQYETSNHPTTRVRHLSLLKKEGFRKSVKYSRCSVVEYGTCACKSHFPPAYFETVHPGFFLCQFPHCYQARKLLTLLSKTAAEPWVTLTEECHPVHQQNLTSWSPIYVDSTILPRKAHSAKNRDILLRICGSSRDRAKGGVLNLWFPIAKPKLRKLEWRALPYGTQSKD